MTAEQKDGWSALDPTMRSAVLCVAVSAAVMTGIALLAVGGRAALGVAIGGGLATANLYVFARIGQAFLGREAGGKGKAGRKGGKAGAWAVIGVLKLGALLGGVWLILRSGVVSSLALVIGYASLIIGITVGTALARDRDDTSDEE